MDIAGLQSEPVHRRQRADGIAALAVAHELWLGCSARGELEQHGIVSLGGPIRRQGVAQFKRPLISKPARLWR